MESKIILQHIPESEMYITEEDHKIIPKVLKHEEIYLMSPLIDWESLSGDSRISEYFIIYF